MALGAAGIALCLLSLSATPGPAKVLSALTGFASSCAGLLVAVRCMTRG